MPAAAIAAALVRATKSSWPAYALAVWAAPFALFLLAGAASMCIGFAYAIAVMHRPGARVAVIGVGALSAWFCRFELLTIAGGCGVVAATWLIMDVAFKNKDWPK